MQTPTLHPEEYDVVVLGSGEAGKYIAWTLAKKGMRAVVIERKYVGGSCPNIACLPSKNIIHSAKVASYFWRSGEFGITKDTSNPKIWFITGISRCFGRELASAALEQGDVVVGTSRNGKSDISAVPDRLHVFGLDVTNRQVSPVLDVSCTPQRGALPRASRS